MIVVKKVNQQEIIVNCELIQSIEFTPDAVMSLTTGDKIIVDETKEDLLRKIIEYKRCVSSGPEVVEWT